jgi:hypothetical protein
MDVDTFVAVLAGDTDEEVDRLGDRWFVSHGDGWHPSAAAGLAAWRAWRGPRTVEIAAAVRGAPTVLELAVGAQASPVPATVVFELDKGVVREVRIYVDPEDAA